MVIERKNILVIGGAGFMGSHLCDYLVEHHHVIALDDFISGAQENIDHLLRNPNFEFIKHDISQPIDLESLPELRKFKIKARGIAQVYNLACPTSAKDFEKYKIQTVDTNAIGTKNALEIALKFKARFLHFSSSVVYGPRPVDGSQFREDYLGQVDFLSPRACYDEGKRFAEAIVATYRQVYNLDAKIARIFTAYGPRMKLFDGQMLPDFIVDALENRDLVIYGDQTFSRSLCYISDILDGAIKLMESEESGPINLGSEEDYRLYDIAQSIIKMTGSKSQIVFKDPLLFMTPLGLPDITLAKEKLGWLPVVRLEDGLQKTIDYTKAHKGLLTLERADFQSDQK